MDELSKQLTLLIVDDARENINLLAEIFKANFKNNERIARFSIPPI